MDMKENSIYQLWASLLVNMPKKLRERVISHPELKDWVADGVNLVHKKEITKQQYYQTLDKFIK